MSRKGLGAQGLAQLGQVQPPLLQPGAGGRVGMGCSAPFGANHAQRNTAGSLLSSWPPTGPRPASPTPPPRACSTTVTSSVLPSFTKTNSALSTSCPVRNSSSSAWAVIWAGSGSGRARECVSRGAVGAAVCTGLQQGFQKYEEDSGTCPGMPSARPARPHENSAPPTSLHTGRAVQGAGVEGSAQLTRGELCIVMMKETLGVVPAATGRWPPCGSGHLHTGGREISCTAS